MKQICILFILISFLWSKDSNSDVSHIILTYKGSSIDCVIDSMGYEYIYFLEKDSVELDSIKLKKIFYIFNNYNKVFYYSWSFEENIRRIQNRTGTLITSKNDSIKFIDILFFKDMIKPEIFLKIGKEKSQFVSLLEVEKIETDFSVLHYAVKRGFYYPLSLFILSTVIEINSDVSNGARIFPAASKQFDDLMPYINYSGWPSGSGSNYQAFTTIIPISVMSTMIYDVLLKKNIFYFNPVFKGKTFDRSMYVFSLRHILESRLHSIIYRIEATTVGGKIVGWLRKKIN